ncbi:flagellin B, partial [Campylobacter lanienae]|uniref:flagellin B n=1 Tax=Campylobacter lanienae TaxID=75658 RepID=UPI00112FB9EB
QTADKAMDEQIKILDTIKTKAIQAAQDGQNSDSRRALQNDISRLLEELDMIATTTSFNGQQLLNGNFSNKNFQIGAYSNETAKVSIGATNSNTIGHTRFETTNNAIFSSISTLSGVAVKLSGIDGYPGGYEFQKIDNETFKSDGYKAVAEMMNGVSDKTGVKVNVNNTQILGVVAAGTVRDLIINGVSIGNVTVKANDSDNALIGAINAKKDETGVEASLDNGRLVLAAKDGRAIRIAAFSTTATTVFSARAGASLGGPAHSAGTVYLGTITFVRQDARDIKVGLNNMSIVSGMSAAAITVASIASATYNQSSVNLKYMNAGTIDFATAKAMGFFDGGYSAAYGQAAQAGGVNTYGGAQAMVDVAESARKTLDKLRADLGSVQNQLVATINNITVTQVNVKSAESQIRDVDFASESANFSKFNILAQSGSYAMSQANAVQQNILRLLQ